MKLTTKQLDVLVMAMAEGMVLAQNQTDRRRCALYPADDIGNELRAHRVHSATVASLRNRAMIRVDEVHKGDIWDFDVYEVTPEGGKALDTWQRQAKHVAGLKD